MKQKVSLVWVRGPNAVSDCSLRIPLRCAVPLIDRLPPTRPARKTQAPPANKYRQLSTCGCLGVERGFDGSAFNPQPLASALVTVMGSFQDRQQDPR